MNEFTYSICVATYKRPLLLKNLVNSIFSQSISDELKIELLIVDNDIDKSAKGIVSEFKSNDKISIVYFNQPQKNISLTRNKAIQNAKGKYLAFIDDDEEADENWLVNLTNTIIKYGADGVFGYLLPKYSEDIPNWLRYREIYFPDMGGTGETARFTYTGNCLLKADIVTKNHVLFDERYGLTGGEDILFFDTLQKFGAKFIYCKEAITYEIISRDRTKIKYLFFRSLQGGNSYGRRMIELKKIPIVRLQIFLRSLLSIFLYGASLLIFIPSSRWVINYKKFSANIGKFAAVFNFHHKHYKN